MGELDEVIHQPIRLRLMATLVALQADAEVDFTCLRDRLQVTDGNLSVHLSRLETARYVKQIKAFVGRKPRTYIRLTARGRDAFEDHVSALEAILQASNGQDKTRKHRT